jgi:hypothetical protein
MSEQEVIKSLTSQGFIKVAGRNKLYNWESPYAKLRYYPGYKSRVLFVDSPWSEEGVAFTFNHDNYVSLTQLSKVADRLKDLLWSLHLPSYRFSGLNGEGITVASNRYPMLKGVVLWENIFEGTPFNLSGFLELVKAVESLDKLIEDYNNKQP